MGRGRRSPGLDERHTGLDSGSRTGARLSLPRIRRDGKYRLYHAGHPIPITGSVRPKHTHTYITFHIEKLDGKHRWRYVTSGNFGLRDKGIVTVFFYTEAVEKYRVRTSFRGDKDHLKDASPWAYFRTTG